MMLRKLATAMLIAGIAICGVAFAQSNSNTKTETKTETSGDAKKPNVKMGFEETKVQGETGGATPISVLDRTEQEEDSLILDRNFKEALKSNVDKETITRQSK